MTRRRGKSKKKLRDKDIVEERLYQQEQDEHFYFIAGYTSNGVPYGITWEEHETETKSSNNCKNRNQSEDDYYYIAGYTEDGEIFGVTWDEYLRSLKVYEMD